MHLVSALAVPGPVPVLPLQERGDSLLHVADQPEAGVPASDSPDEQVCVPVEERVHR